MKPFYSFCFSQEPRAGGRTGTIAPRLRAKSKVSESQGSLIMNRGPRSPPPSLGFLPPGGCHTIYAEHRLPLGLHFRFKSL